MQEVLEISAALEGLYFLNHDQTLSFCFLFLLDVLKFIYELLFLLYINDICMSLLHVNFINIEEVIPLSSQALPWK